MKKLVISAQNILRATFNNTKKLIEQLQYMMKNIYHHIHIIENIKT